jgi:hypothetical protein
MTTTWVTTGHRWQRGHIDGLCAPTRCRVGATSSRRDRGSDLVAVGDILQSGTLDSTAPSLNTNIATEAWLKRFVLPPTR